jgi:hypothetical protein
MRRPGIWVANGSPVDANKMLSWRPGALTSFFDYLGPNRVLQYKEKYPEAAIIVRFQHPRNWHEDVAASARRLADMVASKWPEMRDMSGPADSGPFVYFANEMNLHYENGDSNVGNQPRYESREFYMRYASWVQQTADRIKQRAPGMRLVCPPFAFGHHEDGAPDDSGNPTEAWAGYDYLADTVRSHFDNIVTFHAYWGHAGGSVRDWLYDPKLSSWYAFRWRRVLNLFEKRYGIRARVIVDEAGNFGAADHDFTEQVMHYSRETLADPRVIALTFFLWQDPTQSPGNIRNSWVDRCLNLENHVTRLAAMPDVPAGTLQPVKPGRAIRLLMADGSVRVMEMEEYLRGVVATEMSFSWPLEALKAQAVAARSYAMVAIAHPRHAPNADICTTTHCQAHNETRINPNCDLAVRQTNGQVIRYQNELATAYYSANCGGHTLGNETVFNGPPLPYLRPVECINSGPKNGHGVGMCQWGAHDMAKRGDSYEKILKHYYTGVQISAEPAEPIPPPEVVGGEIRGRVTDAAGNPVPDVRLRLTRDDWAGEAFSGPDGTYRFVRLPAGRYTLEVVGHNLRQEGLTLAEGQRLVIDWKIAAKPVTSWRMQVERRTGLPILAGALPRAGIEVSLQTPVGLSFKRTSGDKPQYGPGGFEFWAPNPGLYRISFLDQQFELTLDGQYVLVTFTETGEATKGSIRGGLRDHTGSPVAGRQIALTGTGLSRTTTSGNDGTFVFADLDAGDYTVSVPDANVSRSVHCDGRSEATVTLTLPAPAGQPPSAPSRHRLGRPFISSAAASHSWVWAASKCRPCSAAPTPFSFWIKPSRCRSTASTICSPLCAKPAVQCGVSGGRASSRSGYRLRRRMRCCSTWRRTQPRAAGSSSTRRDGAVVTVWGG